jgi:hypothetical protein
LSEVILLCALVWSNHFALDSPRRASRVVLRAARGARQERVYALQVIVFVVDCGFDWLRYAAGSP